MTFEGKDQPVTYEGNEAREARRAREKLPVAVQAEMILEAKRKYDASPEAALASAAAAEDAAKAEAKRERKKLRALGRGAVPPPPATGWRARYAIHPVAALFPPLSPDELAVLAADIKAHGLREPVTLTGHTSPASVVDGVNRLDAMEQAGIPFDSTVHARWLNDTEDPIAITLSANLHRRHLTATQKVEIAQAALAYQTGVSHSAVRNPQGGRPLGEVGTLAQVAKVHPNTVRTILDKQKGKPKKQRPRRRLSAGSHTRSGRPDAAWIAQDGQLPELPPIAKERAARVARWGHQAVQEPAAAVPVWNAGQDGYDFEACALRLEIFMLDLRRDVQAWTALREQATGDRRHQLHALEDRGHLIHAQLGELATEVRATAPPNEETPPPTPTLESTAD